MAFAPYNPSTPVTNTSAPVVDASQQVSSGEMFPSAAEIWTIAIPIVATIIIGIIAWLLKRAIDNLEKTDQRIEKKVDKIESFTQVAANSIVEIQTLLGEEALRSIRNSRMLPAVQLSSQSTERP